MEQTKEDLILGYLKTQLALLPSLSKQYTSNKVNRISFLKLKSIAEKFVKGDSNERIILMPGLRGVGKTTLLFQIYEHLKGFEQNIEFIYLSCDNLTKQLNSNLKEILEIYEKKIILEHFEKLNKKIVLLIDEAHYDEGWPITVKNLFDRTKNILIFVSGSCSIAIETNTDLARRSYLERIYPLNFPEYLLLKRNIFPLTGVTTTLKTALFETKSLEGAYKMLLEIHQELSKTRYKKIPSIELELINFLSKGGITSTLDKINQEDVFRSLNSVLEKVIYQDIVSFYPSCKPSINRIFPILHILAGASDKISYDKLNEVVGEKSSKSVIYEILKSLEKAGVIQNVKIEGSPVKIERNSSKYYFASPSLRAALLWSIGKYNQDNPTLGLLMENAAYNTLHKIKNYHSNLIQSISYSDDSGNPDFKIDSAKGKILMEIGWGVKNSSQIKKADATDNFSIIICNVIEPKMDKEQNILYIPRELFLLMG